MQVCQNIKQKLNQRWRRLFHLPRLLFYFSIHFVTFYCNLKFRSPANNLQKNVYQTALTTWPIE